MEVMIKNNLNDKKAVTWYYNIFAGNRKNTNFKK